MLTMKITKKNFFDKKATKFNFSCVIKLKKFAGFLLAKSYKNRQICLLPAKENNRQNANPYLGVVNESYLNSRSFTISHLFLL